MKSKFSKLIAPIFWVIVVSLFVIAQTFGFMAIPNAAVRIIAVIVGISIICSLIYVLFQRYKELEGGEEDDIGNY